MSNNVSKRERVTGFSDTSNLSSNFKNEAELAYRRAETKKLRKSCCLLVTAILPLGCSRSLRNFLKTH